MFLFLCVVKTHLCLLWTATNLIKKGVRISCCQLHNYYVTCFVSSTIISTWILRIKLYFDSFFSVNLNFFIEILFELSIEQNAIQPKYSWNLKSNFLIHPWWNSPRYSKAYLIIVVSQTCHYPYHLNVMNFS